MRRYLLLAAIAVPVALLTACSKDTPKTNPTPATSAHAEVEPFGRLTIDEVEARMAEAKSGKLALLVVDNNQKSRFDQSHLPGAKWIASNEVTAASLPADRDTTLVFYCSNER